MGKGEYELVEATIDQIGRGDLMKRANDALTRIAKDVYERPDVKKARSVTIQIEVKPDDSDQPEIVSKVSLKIPPQKVLMTRGVMRNGKVMVNKFHDDVRQTDVTELTEKASKQ